MALSFTSLTDLPTPPQRTDPDNFASRADAFVDALDDFVTEMNTTITELNTITSGLDQASTIAAWNSSTTYNFPDVVAGSDGHSYRCIDTGVLNQDPTTDDGTYWLILTATGETVPAGVIVAFIGGYFQDGSNGTFTNVIGDNASAINTLLNASGWYVCNGSALNDSESPIWNASGRYLPKIDDERFIQGSSAAGGVGGSNTTSHTHDASHGHTGGNAYLSSSQNGAHTHGAGEANVQTGSGAIVSNDASGTAWYVGSSGSGSGHSHGVNTKTFSTGAPSDTQNRPKYLSCHYIVKVK